jgi:hypothetical protein
MADYAISNVPRRVVYAPSGVGPYAFTFEILDQTDIAVYRASALLTLTTDYTVTINENGTGSVTLVVTAGTSNITIVGAKNIQRTTDFTTGGDLFANTLNDELDNQTIFVQQVAETAERGLRAPVTDPTDINMTLPSRESRAGKSLAFDNLGNPAVGEDVGNWRGDWAAGTSYSFRDLVKDPVNGNVYRVNTSHTSSGVAPLATNPDIGKFDLVLDVTRTPRVESITSASTITPTSDLAEQYQVTALATNCTFAAPTGSPINAQKLIIRIKDNGTARTLTWTTSSGGYRVIGTFLPATTVPNKTIYVGCIYNGTDSLWDVVGVLAEV